MGPYRWIDGSCRTGKPPGLTQWFRRAVLRASAPHQVYGGECVHPPRGVCRDRSYALLGTQPKADNLSIFQRQRAGGAALVIWPRTVSKHGPVGHTDRGKVEYGTQMQRQSRSPRVVAASRVDEQYDRTLRQATYGRLHQRTYSQREQSRFIPPTSASRNDTMRNDPMAAHQHRRRPGWVTYLPRPFMFWSERHKAAAYHELTSWWMPQGWRLDSQPVLHVHELVRGLRPLRHKPKGGR
jgi:hypothetical protein